jgi:hypothetical protein
MTAADAPQELIVDGPLADELERLGVHRRAGDRVKLTVHVFEFSDTEDVEDEIVEDEIVHDGPVLTEVGSDDQERPDGQTAAWEAFVGSFTTGDPDFAERSEEILRAELSQ